MNQTFREQFVKCSAESSLGVLLCIYYLNTSKFPVIKYVINISALYITYLLIYVRFCS
ncbi:hypothetical protein Hanom_Chr07g00672821 [Helianthus anomalus]